MIFCSSHAAGTTDTHDDREIFVLAQRHAYKLHEELREKTFTSLRDDIGKQVRKKNWIALKQILELTFIATFERKPIVLMAVMKNDGEFQEYCECLYGEMKKLA